MNEGMLARWFPVLIPFVGGVLLLWGGDIPPPDASTTGVLVAYTPLGILGGCVAIATGLHAARYLGAGVFFACCYVYTMGCGLPFAPCPAFFGGPAHLNSLVWLPLLIPVNALVLHLLPESAITGRWGGGGLVALVLQFVGLRVGFGWMESGAFGSGYAGLGSVPAVGVHASTLVLLGIAVGVIVCHRPASFYGLYPTPMAAAAVAGVVPFVPPLDSVDPGSGTVAVPLMYSAAGVSLLLGVLVLGRNRAFRDPLSLLRNRDCLLRRLRAPGRSPIMVLLTPDDFGSFQQTYGDEAGDRVLSALGERLRTVPAGRAYQLRRGCFALLYSGWDRESVRDEVQQLQSTVGEMTFAVTRSGPRAEKVYRRNVTLLGGIVEADGDESGERLLERAEETLRKARSEGRSALVEG